MSHDPFLEGLLLSYAAGHLGTHESLVVAAWTALNGAARRKVAAFEALGGRVIDDEEPADLCGSCLESVLVRIDMPARASAAAPASAPEYRDIPDPLHSLLARCGVADVGCWSKGTGVRRMAVRIDALCAQRREMFLMKIAPGCVVPPHRHDAVEITLVLEGEYGDAFGRYRKGDICVVSDRAAVHSPMAGKEGCLCLVLLLDGAKSAASPLDKVLRFFGR